MAEWADMVHFIKHVGRPLAMVVSKDGLFTRERAGLAEADEQAANEQVQRRQAEEARIRQEQEELMDGMMEGDDRNNNPQDEGKEVGKSEGRQEEDVQFSIVQGAQQRESSRSMLDGFDQTRGDDRDVGEWHEDHHVDVIPLENVCFNVAADDVCNLSAAEDYCGNLPCGGGGDGRAVPTRKLSSPSRKDDSWIKSFSPNDDEDDEDADDTDRMTTDVIVSAESPSATAKKNRPWINAIVKDTAHLPVSPIEMSPGEGVPVGDEKHLDLSPVPMSPIEGTRLDVSWINYPSPAEVHGTSMPPKTPVEDEHGENVESSGLSPDPFESPKRNGDVSWINESMPSSRNGHSSSPFDSPQNGDMSLIGDESTQATEEHGDGEGSGGGIDAVWPEEGHDSWDEKLTPDEDDGAELANRATWVTRNGLGRRNDDLRAKMPDEDDEPCVGRFLSARDAASSSSSSTDDAATDPEPAAAAGTMGTTPFEQLRDMFSPIKKPPAALHAPQPAEERRERSESLSASTLTMKESWHTALSSSPVVSGEEDIKGSSGGGIPTSPILERPETPSVAVEEEEEEEEEDLTVDARPAQVGGLFSPIAADSAMPESPTAEPKPEDESEGEETQGQPFPNGDTTNWPSPGAPASLRMDPSGDWNAAASPAPESRAASVWSAASLADSLWDHDDGEGETEEAPAVLASPSEKCQEPRQWDPKEKGEATPAGDERADCAARDGHLVTPPRPAAADFRIHLPGLDPSPGIETPKLEPTPYGKQSFEDAYDKTADCATTERDQRPAAPSSGMQNPKLEPTPYGKQRLFDDTNDAIENPHATPSAPAADHEMKQPKLEPTPYGKRQALDETNSMNETHDTFLQNLRDEFDSPDATLRQSNNESRDDIALDKHHRDVTEIIASANAKPTSFGKKHGDVKIVAKPDKSNHKLLGRTPQKQQPRQPPRQRQNDLSPAGSTVTVEDEKKKAAADRLLSTEERSAVVVPFSERSFRGDEAPESPFVGNVQFSTPNQRVPASALFSQAFVVQQGGGSDKATDVRWVQTDSPLFVVKKTVRDADGAVATVEGRDGKGDAAETSYLQLHSPRMQPPATEMPAPYCAEGPDNNIGRSAFDMSVVEMDDPANTGFEMNETIVYADSMEDAATDCCGIADALCGGGNMFEGLMGDYGGSKKLDKPHAQRQKEKKDRNPSPRRRNLLSRLRGRGKGKKSSSKAGKNNEKKMEYYGNLDEDNEEREESNCNTVGGVRKARVQLTYQNIRGQTMASANQFALLLDDEVCV